MSHLTTKQLAERWGCHPSTVTSLIRRGQLAAMRLGTDWRISEEAAAAYERAHTTSAETSTPTASAPTPEPIRPVFGVLEEGRVLGERWWERETTGAASSAAGRGRATGKKKAALPR